MPTQSMIEKMARAIYGAWSLALAEQWEAPLISYDDPDARIEREAARCAARAALEAMREPTEAMVKGGCDEAIYLLPELTALKGYAKQRVKMNLRWQAMIDTALKGSRSDADWS